MASRWDEGQVLALAPDASGASAGQKVARGDAAWSDVGSDDAALWGRCAGSGSSAYRVAVDLSGPASRCSCPSRKFPCKHALGLLLRWSRGQVPDASPTPDDVVEWVASRRARTEKAAARPPAPTDVAGAGAAGAAAGGGAGAPRAGEDAGAAKRVARREQRVAAGLEELERWLHDQLRGGLAAARHEGGSESARVAARLVDSQAPGAAAMVRDLPWGASDDRWPDRVLAGMARLALLVAAARSAGPARGDGPEGTVSPEVVRSHVGWATPTEEVLTRPGVTDRWAVVWQVDEVDGRLTTRRTHLHGTTTGRDLLVLAWGAAGQPPESGLVPGTVLDADVHVHPGSPVRGVLGERRGLAAGPDGDRVTGVDVATASRVMAAALAADPWVRTVPVVLARVRPARLGGGWAAMEACGGVLPLLGAGPPLGWLAEGGGRPTTVAGELSRDGLRVRAVLGGHEVAR